MKNLWHMSGHLEENHEEKIEDLELEEQRQDTLRKKEEVADSE